MFEKLIKKLITRRPFDIMHDLIPQMQKQKETMLKPKMNRQQQSFHWTNFKQQIRGKAMAKTRRNLML